jgi:outer membrane receptor protein involved in Fe transport
VALAFQSGWAAGHLAGGPACLADAEPHALTAGLLRSAVFYPANPPRRQREQSRRAGDSLTAQAGGHRLKAGFDLAFNQLDSRLTKLEPQTTYYGQPITTEEPLNFTNDYRYYPRTGAIYLQDTYETSDGLVIKAGLRYDWLDPRARRPVIEWVPTTATEFEQQVTGWAPASRKELLSPRIGLAFPLDVQTYFLFNYGEFFQVPLFDQLYSGLNVDLTRGLRVLVGNPDLEHQRTKSYEFAFRREFDPRAVGSLTYFYKESFNLIDTKTFTAGDSRALEDGFTQFVNLPLSRSSGVEVSFERRPEELIGYRVAYTYMVARGHADTELSGLNYLQWGFEPPRTMHYLSWDQRHTIAVEAMGSLAGMDVNLIGRFNSARPYTYAPSASGVLPEGTTVMPNDARMREIVQIDIRVGRDWQVRLGGREYVVRVYGDIRNISDRANVEWISGNGVIGGELRDPGAYRIGRRSRIGLEISF